MEKLYSKDSFSGKYKKDFFYPIVYMLLAIGPWMIINFFPDNLDPIYKEIGFCQSTKSKQGYDSFEISFWVDVIGSILLYLLIILIGKGISSEDRSEIVSTLPGTIMHGIVHYYQYLNQGKFSSTPQEPLKAFLEGPWYVNLGNFAFILGFQYNLQHGIGNFKSILGVSLAIKSLQIFLVPQIYALTYVNTWIILTDILVRHLKPEIRKPYWGDTLLKIMIVILLIEPIIEATNCQERLENYGGHALFDSWIVFYEFVSLGLAYYRHRNEKSKKE
jgi:hypothetical protein